VSASDARDDALALRVRVVETRLARRLQEGKELGPAGGGTTSAARSVVDVVFEAMRRVKWCHEVEDALDSSTQVLHDNWDNLTAAQRSELEKSILELLDAYGENCG
jgi:hypothetical protein